MTVFWKDAFGVLESLEIFVTKRVEPCFCQMSDATDTHTADNVVNVRCCGQISLTAAYMLHVWIGFFEASGSRAGSEFEKLATALSDDYRFAHTSSADVLDKYGYKEWADSYFLLSPFFEWSLWLTALFTIHSLVIIQNVTTVGRALLTSTRPNARGQGLNSGLWLRQEV